MHYLKPQHSVHPAIKAPTCISMFLSIFFGIKSQSVLKRVILS